MFTKLIEDFWTKLVARLAEMREANDPRAVVLEALLTNKDAATRRMQQQFVFFFHDLAEDFVTTVEVFTLGYEIMTSADPADVEPMTAYNAIRIFGIRVAVDDVDGVATVRVAADGDYAQGITLTGSEEAMFFNSVEDAEIMAGKLRTHLTGWNDRHKGMDFLAFLVKFADQQRSQT